MSTRNDVSWPNRKDERGTAAGSSRADCPWLARRQKFDETVPINGLMDRILSDPPQFGNHIVGICKEQGSRFLLHQFFNLSLIDGSDLDTLKNLERGCDAGRAPVAPQLSKLICHFPRFDELLEFLNAPLGMLRPVCKFFELWRIASRFVCG